MSLHLAAARDISSPRMTETELLHELSILRNDIDSIGRSGGNAYRYEAVLHCHACVASHLGSLLLQFAQYVAQSDYECRIKHSMLDSWARYFSALQRSIIQIRDLVQDGQTGR
jgi:hypothetical protein